MSTVIGTVIRHLVGRLADSLEFLPLGAGVGHGLVGAARRVVLSGVGVTGPFLVTVVVLGLVVDLVAGALTPFVAVLDAFGVTAGTTPAEARLLAAGLLGGVVVLAGVVTESGRGTRVGGRAGAAVEAIPGLGSVYTSFDRVSEVLLEGEADSFREVKLVEFPQSGTYALAFVTADGPPAVTAATGEDDMQVLFVPMAPNPVVGGFMLCVPSDRVVDVDMSVQAAFGAIVTSGVATAGTGDVTDLTEFDG